MHQLPNILTGFRFAVIPFLLYCLRPDVSTTVTLVGFTLYTLGAITDWFDGYLARRLNVVSSFGKLMDPLADKLFMTAVLVMLIPTGRVPDMVAFLIIGRELVVTGLRGVAAAHGLVISASPLGKYKAFTQILALGFLMFPLGILAFNPHDVGFWLLYLALGLTLLSGAEYVYRFKRVYVG
ncbi:MAG: CDP-diacylglycerol--glycerol-3-phosphate 3-phosphatidyltransferase [Spirochaetales bacterium]|nr:CDP-diacylglycerol--glycerol-3-phosphate 3-phosphatidyltransferase [Spirochaetales bacterium]